MYYAYRSYGNPPSGNYVFMDDGRLGVLDFGCIQHFSAECSGQGLVKVTDAMGVRGDL
jgi:hypothetical protein